MASDCERRRGLEHQKPPPRIVASFARGMSRFSRWASDARGVAGARAATAGGLVNLVVSGRPTGSLRFRLSKTGQGTVGLMTEHHLSLPGLLT